jgi:hypothetical protein
LAVRNPLTCRDVGEFLADYLARDLAGPQRLAFDEHLRLCPDCVAYLDAYRTTVALGKAALKENTVEGDPEPPPALVEAILRATRAGEHRRP